MKFRSTNAGIRLKKKRILDSLLDITGTDKT